MKNTAIIQLSEFGCGVDLWITKADLELPLDVQIARLWRPAIENMINFLKDSGKIDGKSREMIAEDRKRLP